MQLYQIFIVRIQFSFIYQMKQRLIWKKMIVSSFDNHGSILYLHLFDDQFNIKEKINEVLSIYYSWNKLQIKS